MQLLFGQYVVTLWTLETYWSLFGHFVNTLKMLVNLCDVLVSHSSIDVQCSVQRSVMERILQKHAPSENESAPAPEVIEQQLQTT